MTKWLVTLDDTAWASYAFNYATQQANKGDMIYLLHIVESTSPLSGRIGNQITVASNFSRINFRGEDHLNKTRNESSSLLCQEVPEHGSKFRIVLP